MTKFITLKAQDTFSYTEMEFDFRTGLTSIEGANGSSKSSIFLTLCQGLFNRHPKGGKIEDVNNNVTGKPYSITITFQQGDDNYTVINSRKLSRITITKNGVDISLKKIPDNLALISEILGADYNTFVDLVYQSKESTLNILETTTDKGRKEFVARVLRLDEIDTQLARMKEKEKEIVGKNGRIVTLSALIKTLEDAAGEELAVEEMYDTTLQEKELSRLNLEIGKAKEEVMRLTNEVAEVQKALDVWNEEEQLRDEIARLTQSIDFSATYEPQTLQKIVDNHTSSCAKLYTVLEGLKFTLKQLKAQQSLQEEFNRLEAELATPRKVEMPLADCQLQLEKLNKAWSVCNSKLDTATKELIKFENAALEGKCPTCGHEADVQANIVALEAVIIDQTAYLEKCSNSIDKYRGWIKEWERILPLRQRKANLQEQLENGAIGNISQLEKEIGTKEAELTLERVALSTAKEKQTDAVTQETIRSKIVTLQSKVTGSIVCPYTTDEKEVLVVAAGSARLKATQLESEIAELSDVLKGREHHNAKVRATCELNKQIQESNNRLSLQIAQSQKELVDAERSLALVKTWVGILGSKGYRVARIKKFIASLNKLMGKYAQMISNGRIKCNFFITDTGEIDFTIVDEAKEMSYELWSGGEKARVKLVCLFAVLELLEAMGSLSFNVLALDEIFSALDNAGKEGLFNVLSYLKGQGKAIYTIAHEELALDLQYDHQVKATKLSDGTTEVRYA